MFVTRGSSGLARFKLFLSISLCLLAGYLRLTLSVLKKNVSIVFMGMTSQMGESDERKIDYFHFLIVSHFGQSLC